MLTLDEALRAARDHHPDVRRSQAQLDVAVSRRAQALVDEPKQNRAIPKQNARESVCFVELVEILI